MFELVILLQAELDIQNIFNRHEEFQEGRGELSINHLNLSFSLLERHPEAGPIYSGPYRRLLVRNFSYGIFYQVQPSRVIIAAVMDLRQRSQSIKQKLHGPDNEKF